MSFGLTTIIWAIIICIGIWEMKPKPPTAAFIVSLFVCFETYNYVEHWLPYLSTGQHILFYITPICVFLVVSYFYFRKTKAKWEEMKHSSVYWYSCTAATVFLSFPTLFTFYDWDQAKMKYEHEMESQYGEEWESVLEEIESERVDALRWG